MNSKFAVVGGRDRLAALKGKPLNLSLLSETFNVFGQRENNTFSEIKPSSYVSPDEINRLEDNSKRIGFINTQGLISSIDELTRLLPRNQIDILGVCETFISDATKHNVKIPGYNFIEKSRQNHGKGGLGLFLKEGVHFKRLPSSKNMTLKNCVKFWLLNVGPEPRNYKFVSFISLRWHQSRFFCNLWNPY